MNPLAKLDLRHVWHPFTQMKDWLNREPIVIASAKPAVLRDVYGREYLDANSSIWTNLHGHAHPKINGAIQRQLKKIAHSSALGLANEPASLLAAELVSVANLLMEKRRQGEKEKEIETQNENRPSASFRLGPLSKVFFSDDGSTAMEVALKLAYEYARRSGCSRMPQF